MIDNPIYTCYSLPLHNYLTRLNIRYSVVGRSVTSDRLFWVYVKTDELNMALNNWSNH